MNSQNVLILDDEAGFRNEIGEFLNDKGFRVLSAGRPSEALEILDRNTVDIALFDLKLPEVDGITLLGDVKKRFPDLEVIIMTGYADMSSVIRAMRNGAVDFLKKPFKFQEIKETIDRVAKYRVIKQSREDPSNFVSEIFEGKIDLVGKSKPFMDVSNMLQKIALSSDTTVLLTGESGTGKEMMARAIHLLSNRNHKNFVAVNCSSIPEELFENEFFGHMKGSYTDAKSDQQGLFEAADGGTLFLDEIGELKLSLQAKLLRVLEDKFISRIGSHKEKKVDVRIIAATNQNIQKMVDEKRFRADLFHRLNLFSIHIPALRERREDVPLLFDFFLNDFARKLNKKAIRVDKRVMNRMMQYHFPGNVRELKNLIERAIILCNDDILTLGCFDKIEKARPGKPADQEFEFDAQNLNLEVVERKCVVQALQLAENNKSKAADILNISRQSLDRKIKKYKIRIVK